MNTIHDYSEDFMVSKNITNGTMLRGNVLQNYDIRKIESIPGISFTKITMVIRANGWCDVNANDKILTPIYPYPLRVVTVLPDFDNNIQFKRRKDVGNFTGKSDIYLE